MNPPLLLTNKTAAQSRSTPTLLRLPAFPCVALILLAVVFFGLIRYRLREMPLERDEGEYAFSGQLMLQGIPPYKLAYNMKLPGTYASYAALMAEFGETPAGIHLGLLLINAVTSLLICLLATRLFGRLAGVAAGTTYALLSTSGSLQGFQAHATHFVVLPATLAILCLVYALDTGRSWLLVASGLLAGSAFLMKQHGALLVLFCFVYLAISGWQRQFGLRKVLHYAALFGFAAVLPYAITCWLLHRAGVFNQFWFWTVSYAGEYSRIGIRRGLHAFLMNFRRVFAPAAQIWFLAGLGITAPLWNATARKHASFLAGLLLFSFLAICPGAYFRPHYFVLLLPVTAILAGVTVSSATEILAVRQRSKFMILVPALTFLACFGNAIFQQRAFYFSMSPEQALWATYGDRAAIFAAAPKLSDYVRANSSQDALIAVLGSEPEIYFYARRHSATGYIYVYSLVDQQKYTDLMRQQMISEIESRHPEYVIYVDVLDSWGYGDADAPQVAALLSWTQTFMHEHYERVVVADLGESTQYLFGEAAKAYLPHSGEAIYVLKRKS